MSAGTAIEKTKVLCAARLPHKPSRFRNDLSMAEIVAAANETGDQLSFAELGVFT